MPLNESVTYNDAKLDDEARKLAFEAMHALREQVAANTPSAERVHALSQAVIAACSAMNEDDNA